MATKYVLFRREARHGKVVRSLKPLPNKVNVNMQRFPLFGSGYLAGEYPGGTTTVEGVPQPAEVRALWRGPAGHPADGAVCGTSTSDNDGTWMVTGLSTDLVYDVVGRKEGYNDVIVAGVSPVSLDVITYSGDFIEDETFTKVVGRVSLVGGLPPYSISAVDGVPSGLLPEISGRELLVSGATEAETVSDINITVASSNGVEATIPTRLVFGFKAPANFKAATVVVDDVFSVSLTWEVTNNTQQIKVYRSATPFDLDDLPEPIATLSGTSTAYTDDAVVEDDYFYYMVTAVCEQYELRSNVIAEDVRDSDPHWDKVVALLHFDGDLIDKTGRDWAKNGTQVNIQAGSALFDSGGLRVDGNDSDLRTAYPLDTDTQPFTFELFMRIASYDGPNQSYSWSQKRHTVFSQSGGGGSQDQTIYLDDGFLTIERTAWATGGSGVILRAGVDKVPLNKFVHIAICYDGTTQYGFLDGVLQFAFNVNTGWFNGIAGLRVGRSINIGYQQYRFGANADFDELRITKGVARYTENFVPPSEPFPDK